MNKFVLITNLQQVVIDQVRVFVHALLLDSDLGEFPKQPRHRVRGFGVEASQLVFDLELPSLSYQFEPDSPPNAIAGSFPGARMMSAHGTLTVLGDGDTDDVVLLLDSCSNDGRPVDFETFEGEWTDKVLRKKIWDRLHAKVCDYWDKPTVPVTSPVRVELARKATCGDLR